ncbi:MAG: nucleotide pyrophosphohydrolase [Candidatus Babeliaceae bacterium]|jgi:NTP pyrophosphatase (non-canonical NTP hydrolase)
MQDAVATLEQLKKIAHEFADEREWHQFHTPKNLSMCLSAEAAELMELFLWVESKDSLAQVEDKKEAVEHELADVFLILLLFCNRTGIDLAAALERKMVLNRKKYPVEKVKGKSAKYTEYENS